MSRAALWAAGAQSRDLLRRLMKCISELLACAVKGELHLAIASRPIRG